MRVAVIGSSGLIGQHIVEQLSKAGHAVTTVARTPRPGVDHALDVTTATEAEYTELLAGHDAFVFAAGADSRPPVGKKPCYPYFHANNVEPLVRLLAAARTQGLSRAVVLGSYNMIFIRQHPEWKLAERHPYVKSRVEQVRVIREVSGPDFPVTILELPYVLGRAGDRLPCWAIPLLGWVRSRTPLFAPKGGTSTTTAASIAEATVRAIEHPSDVDIPVADEDLTWTDMLSRMAAASGRPRKVHHVPLAVVRFVFWLTHVSLVIRGREAGMSPRYLADVFGHEYFLHPDPVRPVDAAIDQTCRP
jgi:nucleoside-diphosphate-sugar epimerase